MSYSESPSSFHSSASRPSCRYRRRSALGSGSLMRTSCHPRRWPPVRPAAAWLRPVSRLLPARDGSAFTGVTFFWHNGNPAYAVRVTSCPTRLLDDPLREDAVCHLFVLSPLSGAGGRPPWCRSRRSSAGGHFITSGPLRAAWWPLACWVLS